MNNQPTLTDLFGPPIYTYTRKQALADGFQIDVTKTAAEAGIRFPVFLTRAVFDNYVAVPPGVTGQDEAGRLWDILWLARIQMRIAAIRSPNSQRLQFGLYVRNDNHRAKLAKLVAVCGPLDFDDEAPAITLMMPDED